MTPAPPSAYQHASLLRLAGVLKRVALKKSSLYERIREGSFPAPIKVGSAAVWFDVEINDWMEAKAAARASQRPAP